MEKIFQDWHEKKNNIHNSIGAALFHEREIWWCVLGKNIGYEQDGRGKLFTRPVVILSKFNLDACLIVPLTSRPKKGKYYLPLGNILGRDAIAILSQVRFVDRKRLMVKIGTLDRPTYQELISATVRACFPSL